ncbi:translation initiation factor IF-2 [Saccharicrinis sp. FJH65]|uniref:translation initiation factor IF-2 n=1 Tax=Saccharicrinis sp. FJH65 TaxID=3344659 RepID=UPI0036D2A6F9
MAVRLNKIAREFNVGISTMVEFLHKKGYEDVENNPNTKVNDDVYEVLRREFSSDLSAKKESDKVSEQRHNKEKTKATITLQDGPHENVATDEEEEIPTLIPEDERPSFKIVDKIDLDSIGKKKKAKPEVEPEPEPESELESEPEPETVKEEPEMVQQEEVVDEAVEEEAAEEVEEVAESAKQEDETDSNSDSHTEDENTNKEEVEVFKPSDVKIEQKIKVVDKIDLSTINQKTRPAKKSKEEKKKERLEREKQKNQKKERVNQERVDSRGPVKVDKKTGSGSTDDDDQSGKKKRKRIIKDKEKVNLGSHAYRDSKQGAGKKKVTKGGKKSYKPEISDEDVQKQIKDTLARLTNKGKSKGAKYRRDKRDAVSEKHQQDLARQEEQKNILKLTEFVTVSDLANMMNVAPTNVISTCMSLGLFVSINQRLDAETITIVADEFGYKVEFVSADVLEAIETADEDLEDDTPRSPIVTVMGHVDHGKTSLLDYIRKSNVIEGEAGGITQHIGAYSVALEDGRKITFLDTPGHEAFTAMRARGARVTDIAIIIVAADDDVMPQTVEAINHAAAAGVPIVFAINKIDKPGANPEKIKESLAGMNYLIEEWGGKYQSQDISAKQGLNVTELLEKVLLEAELLDLKANPQKHASGSVVESSLDKGRGYVATVLVQNGTLRIGDVIVSGAYHGHVKAMFNERNQRIQEAGPAEPVLILGLNGAPQAGDDFNVLSSEKEARDIATKREQLQREQGLRTQKHITLDEIGRRIAIGNFQELNVIVKGDVDGSIEALSDALLKLSTEEIQVNIKHKAVGQISEADILLAAASNAIVIGFQVRPSMSARKLAEKEEIDIRLYSIIYDAINEVKDAMEGMLSPDIKEEIVATLEVRDTFKITKVGTIAGCMVKEGKINRNSKIRLIRDGIVIYTGELGSLKRFKDDVKEVASGYECGLNIQNFNDIKIGDIIEGYKEVEVKKTL